MIDSGWTLKRIESPAVEPVTLAEAKTHCQIDPDLVDLDAWLSSRIKAARELAEEFTKSSFIEQRWRLTAEEFPCGWRGRIKLPRGPIIQVDSISFLDLEGARQTLNPDYDYSPALDGFEPVIHHGYNVWWPSQLRCAPGSVQVDYLAGYESAGSPAGADGVPELIKQAICSLVADWVDKREDSQATNVITQVPHGFYAALQPFRYYP